MSDLPTNEYRDQRIANMEGLVKAGYEPFGRAYERTGRLSELLEQFEEEKPVKAAGRLVSIRKMGKSIFAHLFDGSARMQIFVSKKELGEEAFAAFKLLDLGDHIGADGNLFVTRTGEQSIRVSGWTPLSKALLPLPEKFHGLKDVEARYRQRYLDLVANEESRLVFQRRVAIIHQ